MIYTFLERWEKILYPDIWFIGVNHSLHGDFGTCLRYVNLLKPGQVASAFSGIVAGNSKSEFSGVVEGNGLTSISPSTSPQVLKDI